MVFYQPGKTDHGLPRDPFKACVVPRPIGWISTRNKQTGVDNLAPYSQFNNLTFDPPYVMFSANQDVHGARKNTVTNAEASGVFCWNIATWELREAVNQTAEWFSDDVDEFATAGLEKLPGTLVDAPMVARSPVRFECEYYSTLRLPGNPPMGSVDVVIGRVVGIHIDESVLTEGKVDLGKVMPIARCGYFEYAVIRSDAIFEMIVPGDPKMMVGLEGNVKLARKINVGGEAKNKMVEGEEKAGAVIAHEVDGKA